MKYLIWIVVSVLIVIMSVALFLTKELTHSYPCKIAYIQSELDQNITERYPGFSVLSTYCESQVPRQMELFLSEYERVDLQLDREHIRLAAFRNDKKLRMQGPGIKFRQWKPGYAEFVKHYDHTVRIPLGGYVELTLDETEVTYKIPFTLAECTCVHGTF